MDWFGLRTRHFGLHFLNIFFGSHNLQRVSDSWQACSLTILTQVIVMINHWLESKDCQAQVKVIRLGLMNRKVRARSKCEVLTQTLSSLPPRLSLSIQRQTDGAKNTLSCFKTPGPHYWEHAASITRYSIVDLRHLRLHIFIIIIINGRRIPGRSRGHNLQCVLYCWFAFGLTILTQVIVIKDHWLESKDTVNI